ncbi:hypothetical protein [uncultured Desulfovibrio sp.]|uniref:hypothetical protein n=1 Tax=Desulfovibrio sp. TaxID=885 RepID=UPI002632C388|nr:hypothetical protein [uncultured Desulfovibrio sp.]
MPTASTNIIGFMAASLSLLMLFALFMPTSSHAQTSNETNIVAQPWHGWHGSHGGCGW